MRADSPDECEVTLTVKVKLTGRRWGDADEMTPDAVLEHFRRRLYTDPRVEDVAVKVAKFAPKSAVCDECGGRLMFASSDPECPNSRNHGLGRL